MEAHQLDDMAGIVRDSAASLLQRAGGVKRARDLRFKEPGFGPQVWSEMAGLGWIGLRVPERAGGAGFGVAALCALSEELGAALAPEPLIESALSAALLASCAAGRKKLPDLLSGRRLVFTAWQEGPDGLETPGAATGDRLFVPHGFGADSFLVLLRTETGLSLLEVDARDVEFLTAPTQDGGTVCTLRPAPRFHGETLCEDASQAVEAALREACLATASYLLGLCDASFSMTLDYLKIRRQFGKPIGSFQTLRHRAADLKIDIELLRSAIAEAAQALDSGAAKNDAGRAVSRAKAKACDVVARVTREAIQMHGAIGYTDEHDIGLYLRKAMTVAPRYGSALWHRRAWAQQSPWAERLVQSCA